MGVFVSVQEHDAELKVSFLDVQKREEVRVVFSFHIVRCGVTRQPCAD
jgi:hypothetical protein